MRINRTVFLNELARNCMTLKELSRMSGVNTVTLTRINQGTQNPMPATVGRIAKALGVPVEVLIKEED